MVSTRSSSRSPLRASTLRKRNSNTQSLSPPSPSKKGNKNVITASAAKAAEGQFSKIIMRLVFGWLMIGTFGGIIYAGHIYAWLFVVLLQILIFRELVQVRYKRAAEKNIPYFRTIQWGWFGVAMLYNYGDSLEEFAKTDKAIIPSFIAQYLVYHPWISFILYAVLFVGSVLSLKKGLYKYQMGNFTWTVVTIGLIVGQMRYVMTNIFTGFFWFVFPAALVVCNDCFAYFCGRAFGRKFVTATFLKVSPNKTWEGFIGAFFCTLLFGFFASKFLAQFSWMTCPITRLQFLADPLHCTPPAIFQDHIYPMPTSLIPYLGNDSMTLLPIQIHSFVFSSFISLIAPFGGFLASAIKRTYDLKDFDSTIPGHGGVFDRMDCQLITSLFTWVYYNTFLRTAAVVSIPRIMNMIASLSEVDKHVLLNKLQEQLLINNP